MLFGAEVAFAEQNVATYEFEPDSLKVSRRFRSLLTLRIVHFCVKKFQQGEKPPGADEISDQLEIPIRLVREILFELTEAGILSEVKLDDPEAIGFQPARTIEKITVFSVMDQLDQQGIDSIPIAQSKDLDKLKASLVRFHEMLGKSPENLKLKDI